MTDAEALKIAINSYLRHAPADLSEQYIERLASHLARSFTRRMPESPFMRSEGPELRARNREK